MLHHQISLHCLLSILVVATTSLRETFCTTGDRGQPSSSGLGTGASISNYPSSAFGLGPLEDGGDNDDDDFDDPKPKLGAHRLSANRARFSLRRRFLSDGQKESRAGLPSIIDATKKIDSLLPYFNQVFTTLRQSKLRPSDVYARLELLHDHRQSFDLARMVAIGFYYDLNDLDPTDCNLDYRLRAVEDSEGLPALGKYVSDRNELQYYACFRELKRKIDLVLSKWNQEERDAIRQRFKKLKETLMLDSDDPVKMVRKFLDPSGKQMLIDGMSRYVCLKGRCSNKLSKLQQQQLRAIAATDGRSSKSKQSQRKQLNFLGSGMASPAKPSILESLAQVIDTEEFQFRNLASQVLVQPCEEALKIWGPIKDYFDVLASHNRNLLLAWIDSFSLNAMLGTHICQNIKSMQQNEILGQLWQARKNALLQANIVENKLQKLLLSSDKKTMSDQNHELTIPHLDDNKSPLRRKFFGL